MKISFMFFIPLHALHVRFASSDTQSVARREEQQSMTQKRARPKPRPFSISRRSIPSEASSQRQLECPRRLLVPHQQEVRAPALIRAVVVELRVVAGVEQIQDVAGNLELVPIELEQFP